MAEYIEKEALLNAICIDRCERNYRGICTCCDEAALVKHFPAADVVELSEEAVRQLFYALYALADMVNQFGYTTTFLKQDAVCDGGLSALETAFTALNNCGCRVNSNWTISRKHLWEFMDDCERRGDNADNRRR